LVGLGARTRRRAVGRVLRDQEVAARLRVRRNRVPGGAVVRYVHLAGTGTDVEAGGRAVDLAGCRHTLRVVLLVRVAGLDLRHHVARIGLRRRVLALLLLAEEGRQGDRGKNADDQDDDEELDQREAALLGLNSLAELPQHLTPPRVRV